MSKAIKALRSRGLLSALTHDHAGITLDQIIAKSACSTRQSPSVYCGFDPTADSLHVGNLLQAIALRHFQLAGMRPILLVGGATGMIGDPSGKSEERALLSDDVVLKNSSEIMKGLSSVLDFQCPKVGAIICNNAEWHTNLSAVEWMRDIGRYFRVNTMLSRESVKKRLESGQGISFLEFSYQLFQAYDFLHLYKHYNCMVQIGGSDQWGNIASGCDLVRKSLEKDVYGITLPLLTTSNGEKYGKSAGNAVWLDSKKTSAFEFYQYFVRVNDNDIQQFLLSFTQMTLEDIKDLMIEHSAHPEQRLAQRTLAEHMTKLVHGERGLWAAKDAASVFFDKKLMSMSANQLVEMSRDARQIVISRNDICRITLIDLLVYIGAAKSKAEARRLIKGGGVNINDVRINSENHLISDADLIESKVILIRIGKRNNFVVKVK